MNLRDYQEQDIATLQYLFHKKEEKALLAVLFTGAGKTEIVIKYIMENYDLHNQRVLILADRTELIMQFYRRFLSRQPELASALYGRHLYPAIGIEMSDRVDSTSRILIATRQTLAADSCRRLKEVLEFGLFDLCVIDEADLGVTQEYLDVMSVLRGRNPDGRLLGVTATTQRADNVGLGILFNKIATNRDIKYGISNGWIKPVYAHICEAVTLGGTTKAMYVADWKERHLEKWLEFGGPTRHTIHSLPNIEDSEAYCRFMQCLSYPTVHIDSYKCIDLLGRTHEDVGISYAAHRDNVFGELQREAIYACHLRILARGFDWPKCNFLMKSSTMAADNTFTQFVGRGTRLPSHIHRLLQISGLNEPLKFRVTYSDQSTAELLETELGFYANTILLDFAASDSMISTVGTLAGLMQLPAKPLPKIEEEEEVANGILFPAPEPDSAQSIRHKERKLYRELPTHWFTDPDGDSSTHFGREATQMVYISNVNYQLASGLYNALQKLKYDQGDSEKTKEKIKLVEQVYEVCSNWMLWIVTLNHTYRLGENTADLASLLYPDLPRKHTTQASAIASAAVLSNYVLQVYVERGSPVDLVRLDSYAKNRNPPTEKQLGLIESLSESLNKVGLKGFRLATPHTLNAAHNAIQHLLAKHAVASKLRSVAAGNTSIDSLTKV